MKIYLVLIEDRHTDTQAFPFSTAEAAIAYARVVATERAREEGPREGKVTGWLYYAVYAGDSDCVWVIEKELDSPEE